MFLHTAASRVPVQHRRCRIRPGFMARCYSHISTSCCCVVTGGAISGRCCRPALCGSGSRAERGRSRRRRRRSAAPPPTRRGRVAGGRSERLGRRRRPPGRRRRDGLRAAGARCARPRGRGTRGGGGRGSAAAGRDRRRRPDESGDPEPHGRGACSAPRGCVSDDHRMAGRIEHRTSGLQTRRRWRRTSLGCRR